MTKDEIYTFWRLTHIISTIPDEAFGRDPQAQIMLNTYHALSIKYNQLMAEVNSVSKQQND